MNTLVFEKLLNESYKEFSKKKHSFVKSLKSNDAGRVLSIIDGAVAITGVGIGIVFSSLVSAFFYFLYVSKDFLVVSNGSSDCTNDILVLFSINENNTGSFPVSLLFLGLGTLLVLFNNKTNKSSKEEDNDNVNNSTGFSDLSLNQLEEKTDPLSRLNFLNLEELEALYNGLPFYFSENKSLGVILGILLGFVSLYLWPKRHMYARVHVFEYWQTQFGWFDITMVRIVKYFLPGLQAFIVAVLNLVIESIILIHVALFVNYWATKRYVKSIILEKKKEIFFSDNSVDSGDTVYSVFEFVNENSTSHVDAAARIKQPHSRGGFVRGALGTLDGNGDYLFIAGVTLLGVAAILCGIQWYLKSRGSEEPEVGLDSVGSEKVVVPDLNINTKVYSIMENVICEFFIYYCFLIFLLIFLYIIIIKKQ